MLLAAHAVDALVPVETDPLTLLRAAEELTRLHTVENFPPGSSLLTVALSDRLNEDAP